MIKRFIHAENAYRKAIYREVNNLVRDGWFVMASHIPEFPVPPEIEGFRPDIYAVREDETYIMDICMEGTVDQNRLSAHTGYARFDEKTHFSAWVVNGAGCRVTRSA